MTRPRTTRRPVVAISKKQINVIMLICAQFGISKEDRKELLEDRYGKASTSDLTSDQAGHFIQEYEKKGFRIISRFDSAQRPKAVPERSRRPVPRTGNVIALANRNELEKIAAMAELIEWRVEGGLVLFLEKRMGIKDGKVRTSGDSYLAIEGLKKMFENQMKSKHGNGWKQLVFEQPAVMDYIALHPQVVRR